MSKEFRERLASFDPQQLTLEAYRVVAKELFQLTFSDSTAFAEKLRTDDIASMLVRKALVVFLHEKLSSTEGLREIPLSAFLACIEPPLTLCCKEISLAGVPAQIREHFDVDYAARHWIYWLSRADTQVEGYWCVGAAVAVEEPSVWDIVRDLLIGDISDDAMSAQDTEHLKTLFSEAELECLRCCVDWEV